MNLSAGTFNNNGVSCWIASKPPLCDENTEVECIRGANAVIYSQIFAGIPCAVSFVGVIYVMVVISWTVIKQERRNARVQFQQARGGNQNTRHSFFRHLRSIIGNPFSRRIREAGDSNNIPVPTYATRGTMSASQNRVRVALTQSLLYIGAFLITYTGWFAIVIFNVTKAALPFPLLVEHYMFSPLCGFFNILVYTRPKVSMVRRCRPEYWWFKAFWVVVQAGGDMPELPRLNQAAASENHTDASAMRSRLAPASSQLISSCIKDEDVIDEGCEPPNSSKQPDRGFRFHPEDDVAERLELAAIRSEEEEFNVDAGPATVQSLTQHEPRTNEPPAADNLDELYPSFEAADTIDSLSAGGDIP